MFHLFSTPIGNFLARTNSIFDTPTRQNASNFLMFYCLFIKNKMSDIVISEIINLIREKPILWNSTLNEYKNRYKREVEFEDIARKVNLSS